MRNLRDSDRACGVPQPQAHERQRGSRAGDLLQPDLGLQDFAEADLKRAQGLGKSPKVM